MDRDLAPKRVALLGFDGVVASHLTSCADAFAAAALNNGYGGRIPCYEVCVVGLTAAPFRSESGTVFKPSRTLRNAPECDTLIIPGGAGIRKEQVSGAVAEWVLKRASTTRRIATICTGIYGLAPTGLLDDHEVTTHWRFVTDVSRRFPTLKVNHKRQIVKAGSFYTSTGITAGVNLSLMLIEEDYGPHLALSVRQELVTYLGENKDTGVETTVSATEPADRLAELVAWMLRNLHEDLSVEVLARRACICPRHFSRAFKSVFGIAPAEFVEGLRLNEARRRLSTQRKTLKSVGASVGFPNATMFSRAFQRRFGTRPGDYIAASRRASVASVSEAAAA